MDAYQHSTGRNCAFPPSPPPPPPPPPPSTTVQKLNANGILYELNFAVILFVARVATQQWRGGAKATQKVN